jgi:hypothetical protein
MSLRRSTLVGFGVALLLVAALTASAGASGRANDPPCTKQALGAGLKRGAAQPGNARITGSFACDDGWAYSGIEVGGGQHGFDAIAVFRAQKGVWVTVNRAKPCRTRAIPKTLYQGACTTS